MAGETILINRAPVLALWASVVAERLGFSRDEALSLGKAVTGLNAQSKGQHLGIYIRTQARRVKSEERKLGQRDAVELMGREIPVVRTPEGVRAVNKDKLMSPESIQAYLESKFGERLAAVRAAMEELARSMKPDVLAARAFALYAQFRPQIPDGVKGWGAKGQLDLDLIRSLGSTK
ncbi:MAG: hypothetical protein NTX53_14685 [candidate division WOR-3 bacterium]|nr:hypothetical protein [candidate division WOR-3 bacterium]